MGPALAGRNYRNESAPGDVCLFDMHQSRIPPDPVAWKAVASRQAVLYPCRRDRMRKLFMTRALTRSVARTLLALYLFAQMLVAAHACPAMSPNDAGNPMNAKVAAHAVAPTPPIDQDRADMAGCDDAQHSANLCAAHCQASDQNTDSAQVPAVPANLLSSFYVVQIPSASSGFDRNSIPSEFVNAIPPPHAILHCCFRI